jgi:hypothetical protein
MKDLDFSVKLKAWDESGLDNGDEARYVRLALARHLEKASKGGAAPQAWPSMSPVKQGAAAIGSPLGRPFAQQRAEPLQTAEPPSSDITWTESDSDTGAGPDGERYKSFHVYGGKFAACFSEDTTQRRIHTIRVEATEASGQRTYNWKNKIAIQLS